MQAINAVQEVNAQHVLVVMPLSLKPQWAGEIAKVEAFNAPPNSGTFYDEVEQVVVVYKAGVQWRVYHLAHYEQFTNNSKALAPYLARQWDVVILDEAHNIKNRNAQRTENIKQLTPRFRWMLTGTPVAEFPQDVWSLLNWAAPDVFVSYWDFVSVYCDVDPRGKATIKWVKDPVTGRHTQEPILKMLRENLKPYLLARNLEDAGIELPPLTTTLVPLAMQPDQAEFYKEVEEQVILELSTDPVVHLADLDLTGDLPQLIINTAGARFTRLHQAASHPGASVFLPKGGNVSNVKLAWLENYVTGGGAPAVIFARYKDSVAAIKALLKRLNANPGFIVSTYALGSTGHNWQHLNVIIQFDEDYSRLTMQQAYARAHRIGQTRPVMVYQLVVQGSIDERVRNNNARKQTIVTMIVEWLRGIYDSKKGGA